VVRLGDFGNPWLQLLRGVFIDDHMSVCSDEIFNGVRARREQVQPSYVSVGGSGAPTLACRAYVAALQERPALRSSVCADRRADD